ncbi:MAG: aldo/keto reductase [Lentisphaeria bacterium]
MSIDTTPRLVSVAGPSLLGFGCMRFTLLPGSQAIDEEQACALLAYAYDHGVNYFDTAWGYHEGKSEQFVGRALQRYPRESYYLASKMPGWLLQDLAGAKELLAKQLQRCQVKYFDYYLLHSLTTQEEFERLYLKENVLDYLREQKQAGRIGKLGFSFHGSLDFMKYLLANQSWDFVQIQLNYQDWHTMQAAQLYELVVEKYKLPCIIMEPLRGGALANLNEEGAAILKEASPQSSLASWGMRFVAALPGVMCVLSGMNDIKQLQDNLKTFAEPRALNAREQETLQKALQAYLKLSPIPCSACNYCMPCPFNVDIPGNFRAYNKCAGKRLLEAMHEEEKKQEFLELWQQIAPENQPDKCSSCAVCLSKCPQHIDIPARMLELKELLLQAN